MIKAILLDFGGVYIQSPFAVIGEVAADMQVSEELLLKIIFGDYDIDGGHPWHRLERGEILLDEARLLILQEGEKHQLKTDIYEMLARFAGVDRGIRGPLVEKTLEWKQAGYKLGMITNNIKEFTSWRTAFPFDLTEVFDVVADSSYLGMRKPDPMIYQYVLKQLDIAPEEALFLDDYPSNVHAAQALGIHAFQVGSDIQLAIDWVDEQLA